MLVSELGGSRQRACARARLLARRPREEAAAAAAALPPVAQRAPFGHKRDELAAGAKDRTGWAVRIAWRPLHHAAGCASAAGHWRRAQRRGAALPVELHDARVRGDGAAQGGAHGVGRAHCAPAQLPNSWQDKPVRVHPNAATSSWADPDGAVSSASRSARLRWSNGLQEFEPCGAGAAQDTVWAGVNQRNLRANCCACHRA